MDTKLAAAQVRLQQWAAIVRERKESGLKVDDYCETHNISRNAYYYWLRKLREAALESQSPRFVELPVPAAEQAEERTEQMLDVYAKFFEEKLAIPVIIFKLIHLMLLRLH